MLPMPGLTLPMFFSPPQRKQLQPSLAFSPFQRSSYGGPLADCGGSLASLPNIFLTSSGLMFLAGLLESRICLSSLQLPSTIMGKPPHSLVLFGQTLSHRTNCQTCQRRCHQCRARCRRLQLPPPARVVEVFVAQNPNRARPSGPVQISMKPRSSRTTAPAHSAIIEIKDNAIEISGPIETGDFE